VAMARWAARRGQAAGRSTWSLTHPHHEVPRQRGLAEAEEDVSEGEVEMIWRVNLERLLVTTPFGKLFIFYLVCYLFI